MESRFNPQKVSPEVYKAMFALETAVKATGLESKLLELVRLRASQINGCAFCIDMHSKDARAAGETEQRIYVLDAWRSPFYSDRERAALAWTEAVTLITVGHVPDEVYEEARRHFSDDELAKLTLGVVSINGWNRFSIAFAPCQDNINRPTLARPPQRRVSNSQEVFAKLPRSSAF